MAETHATTSAPETVVILGGSGFLGGALTRALRARGGEVRPLSSREADLTRRDGLAALEGLEPAQTTFVVASAITPDKGRTIDALEANLLMAVNVARYLETHALRRCVFLSSDAVYGWESEPITEETPLRPSDFYGLAKAQSEQILGMVAGSAGVPLLVIRPPAIFGAGDSHNSYGPNRFIGAIARGEPVRVFGGGEETRDHLYVDDFAALTVYLIERGATGVYNVVSGTARSFASVLEDLQAVSPAPFEIEHAPRAAGAVITHRSFDASKLRAAVGEPVLTDWRAALRVTLEAAGEQAS